MRALLHLIKHPNATHREAGRVRARARFPDRRRLVEPRDADPRGLQAPAAAASACAPRWESEDTGRGTYQIVVTEIPYQVQKAKLVERIAELMSEKKLPLLGDVRDESAEDDPPRARAEERAPSIRCVLMESLFRLTELETRFALNMNVLVGRAVPSVLSLKDVLQQWLDHRQRGAGARARSSAWRRSSTGSRCSTATSSPTSTSTR